MKRGTAYKFLELKDDNSEEAREIFQKAVDYIEVKKQKIADIIKSVTDRIVEC